MDVCIILAAEGTVVIRSAELGGALVDEPVAQIAPGETFAGVPYEVWRTHLGEAVALDDVIHEATRHAPRRDGEAPPPA